MLTAKEKKAPIEYLGINTTSLLFFTEIGATKMGMRMVNGITISAPQSLTLNGNVIDITELIKNKAEYLATYRGKLVEAKIRLYSTQEADKEDLEKYLEQFMDWTIRKISINSISPMSADEKIEIDGVELVKYSYFAFSTNGRIAQHLKCKSLREAINFLNRVPSDPNGIDMISLMTISNSLEVITLGCIGDCKLTFQGASEYKRYREFIKFWQDKINLRVGVCGKLEVTVKEDITKVVSTKKKKEITGWSCF